MAIHDWNYGGKKNGTKFFIVLAIIGMIFMIGRISDTSEPKCIESGCDNKQTSNSSYCYLHKPYKRTSSGNYSRDSKSDTLSDPSYNSEFKNTTSGSSGSSKQYNSYGSYDEGYDDIEMDGDYDYDRYDSDSDYADGVDDAMDEFDEDW